MVQADPTGRSTALAEHYPELTLRTEPAHREAYVALGPAGGTPVQWQLASESLSNWAAESGIDDESLWLRFEDLGGPRITYLVTPPVTETSVPDCDFAVPFASSDDRSPEPGQALRLHRGRQRPLFLHPARHGHRLPRPERRREDHHHADDPGPRRADAGLGHRRRPQLPRPAGTHARGGRSPRRQGAARWPPGLRPPALPGPEQRHPPQPGGRGAPHRRSRGRGQASGEGLLAGHGPAARHRLGAPRGPGGAHLRRTGERPRPRRHPLGPDPHAGRSPPRAAPCWSPAT
jgi:hypothetical protein